MHFDKLPSVPYLSLIIPSTWGLDENLLWRKRLIEEIYHLDLEKEVEIIFGLHRQGETSKSGIVTASRTSNQGFSANLANVIESATGSYVLILGQDDGITIENVRYLLEEIKILSDNGNGIEQRFWPTIMCHIDYHGKSPEPNKLRQDIFMRLGSSPGVCLPNSSPLLADLSDYERLFPEGIYPQVWIGMLAYERGGVIFSDVRVQVGPGPTAAESMHDHWQRPSDYGVKERLRIASALEHRSKRQTWLAWRLSRMRLIIWASTVYRNLEKVGEGDALMRMTANLKDDLSKFERLLMVATLRVPKWN